MDMHNFYEQFSALLGLDLGPRDLTFLQVSLRGLFVFMVTLAIVRAGPKRSLARKTAFDAILLVILASVLSRAINGNSSFFPTLGGAIVIVIFHHLLGLGAYRFRWIGFLIKGEPEVLVANGERQRRTMQRNHISDHDLEEDLRLSARMEDIAGIRVARIERSGDISFIKKQQA